MTRPRILTAAVLMMAISVWGCESQQSDVLGPDGASDTPLLKKGGVPGPPGGGDGGNQCNLTFSAEILTGNGNFLESDPNGLYVNKDQKVQITGGETGWRFDTNGMQGWTTRDKRRVLIDGASVAIDMRFAQNSSGLNFCDLDYTGENGPVSGTVPVVLSFSAEDGTSTTWRYGGVTHDDSHDCGADFGSDPVTVERVGADQWSITSGTTACVIESGNVVGTEEKDFYFTVTRL